MSFPSEILRTGTNIAQKAIKREHKRSSANLRNIGYEKIIWFDNCTSRYYPYGVQKGFQSLYGVTNEEADALKRYLPVVKKLYNYYLLEMKIQVN